MPPATRISASLTLVSAARVVRSGTPSPCDSTNRRMPAATSSATRLGSVGRTARRQGYSASRAGRASSPMASQSPATARQSASRWGQSAIPIPTTTRVAPAANTSRISSGPSTPPATWSGAATLDAIRPIASRFPGRPARAPSKSTTWIKRAPRATKPAAIRSGRSVGVPSPVAAPGHETRRDRPPSRSIDGMTCTPAIRDPRCGRWIPPRAPGSPPGPRAAAADGS